MSQQLTIDEVLVRAGDGSCPPGLPPIVAIAAHREAVRRQDLSLCHFTLRAIAVARMADTRDHLMVLSYLRDLPDGLWDGGTEQGLRARTELLGTLLAQMKQLIH